MHDWGDEDWNYWDDLSKACAIIRFWCFKIGRFGGQIKEKYGTLRFYANFHYQLHDLFYPGHYYIRWGNFLNRLDLTITQGKLACLYQPFIGAPIRVYQRFIYRFAYKRALSAFPHIREEILCCADYPELLKDL